MTDDILASGAPRSAIARDKRKQKTSREVATFYAPRAEALATSKATNEPGVSSVSSPDVVQGAPSRLSTADTLAWRPDVNRYLSERPWTKVHPWLFETLIDFALMAKPMPRAEALALKDKNYIDTEAVEHELLLKDASDWLATAFRTKSRTYRLIWRLATTMRLLRRRAEALAPHPQKVEEEKDDHAR